MNKVSLLVSFSCIQKDRCTKMVCMILSERKQ